MTLNGAVQGKFGSGRRKKIYDIHYYSEKHDVWSRAGSYVIEQDGLMMG